MSIKIKVYNQSGEATKEIELNPDVFGVAANPALVHQAYVAQIANERQVLAHTKDRSEVRGGGRKPWRQKGTGRARAGSSRSPLWIGGGVTFGPTKDRNFKKNINRKMKQKALLMALSDRASQNNLFLIDKLEMAEYKTKVFNNLLMKLTVKTEEPDGQLKAGAGKEARKTKKAAENSEKGKSAVKKNKRSILIINDKSDKIV
ncbi:MAG: 50S ribosomal protein L4, partial [Planctomycetes bacterium]|nr:50S ribosomal protein L4 [Planctomycetota bacterium]